MYYEINRITQECTAGSFTSSADSQMERWYNMRVNRIGTRNQFVLKFPEVSTRKILHVRITPQALQPHPKIYMYLLRKTLMYNRDSESIRIEIPCDSEF
eukprot:COSAG02_NODE_552_length_20429_cov_28.014068_1_plen_99_part_00